MPIRRIIGFAGALAILVGTAGLLTPVSVSPELQTVRCGSAASPDMSAARANDDGSDANIPVTGGVVTDVNYTELCRMEIEDRRVWTITLAALGVLAVVATVTHGAMARSGASSAQ
jgi:hypothetical protein